MGSGAAGATAARVLVDTGASVAVVEEGHAVKTEEFGAEVQPAFQRLFRNMGSQIARGKAYIPVIQGSCLGGSTVINSAIMWRLPSDVWAEWQRDWGLGEVVPEKRLHEHFDQIERELSVVPAAREIWGGHNEAMHRGAKRLQLDAEPIRRADAGCRGSARCMSGCPHGAKQSMILTYLPYASERGATLFTSARVDRVELAGDRAVAARGWFHVPGFRKNLWPFTLRARRGVVVACSAIQTPGLLARSGVHSPHLGRHFQGHPGSPLLGLFDEPVNMWFGATQGYDMFHYRRSKRFKIETLSLPPELAFVRLPGIGRRWLRSIAESPYIALWGVQVRAYAQGEVKDRLGGAFTDILFSPEPRDMALQRAALRSAADMLFAAGARQLIVPIHGMPERINSPDDVHLIDRATDDPGAYSYILSHLFGTARMTPRASDGVVGTDFAVHGTQNLWVVDSSIFPTNLGVNPQETIMGVAMEAAERIADRTRPS